MEMDATDWYVLGAIAALTVCSIITRSGYFVVGKHFPLTEGVRSALRYAPVAALVAIIVPEVLPMEEGAGALLDRRFLSVLVAAFIYLRTRNTLMVIVGGMLAFWVMKALSVYI